MTDPVVTVQPDVITVVVNNDQDAVTVVVGSDAMAPLALSASAAAAAASAAATAALASITAILQSSLSGDAVIYTDRVTGILYRLVMVDGELFKEEVDPSTVIVSGSRGLWGVLVGL